MEKRKWNTVPKKWNCCDELVSPKDLGIHYLKKHSTGCNWNGDAKKLMLIVTGFIVGIFLMA